MCITYDIMHSYSKRLHAKEHTIHLGGSLDIRKYAKPDIFTIHSYRYKMNQYNMILRCTKPPQSSHISLLRFRENRPSYNKC